MLSLDASQILVQIVGFLLMFWILKRFGWKPLLEVLEKRKEAIQQEWDEVAEKKNEADALAQEYEEKLRGIEMMKRKAIQDAATEGKKVAFGIQEEAEAKAKEVLLKAHSEVDGELDKAKRKFREEMVDLILSITKKLFVGKEQKALIEQFVEEAKLK